jgi:RNA polymerase sigma-70 factor (ECF subfamily)
VNPPPRASTKAIVPDHPRWFAEEVHAHDTQLKAYLRSAFPDVRDVDDVVQESYLRVWRAKLAGSVASVRAFLFQVARNVAIDTLREAKSSPVDRSWDLSTLNKIEDKPTAADALCYEEKVSLVAGALTRLPARCREVFILRKFKRVPQRDIAAQLGISERTVESQVTRGMKLIETYLRKRGVSGFSHET